MKPLLKYIRFPTMEMNDVAREVAPTNLLSEQQTLEIYSYLALGTEEERNKMKMEFDTNPRSGGKRLKFASILDTNGLIYFIGTNGLKSPYSNPVKSGQVLVKVSSTGGSAVDCIADRNPISAPVENSYGSDKNPWITIQFQKYIIRPTEWVIAQDQDHFIQNWRLEGKEKGKTEYVLIEEYKNEKRITDTVPHQVCFKVKSSKMFQEFRIYLTGPGHKGQANFDITYVEFYGYFKEIK